MIYYNNNTINDWDFGSDNIAKVYYGVQGSQPRLPSGYTEVEYVQNTGSSSVNLGIQLMKNANDSFEVVFDNVMTYTSGGGNLQTFITCAREISPYEGWYERFDNGNVVIAGNLGTATLSSGRTIVSGDVYHTSIGVNSTPSNRTHDYPLVVFSSLNSSKSPWRYCKGKLYNMTVTYNNELVRNLVPCKNSLNVAGLYDLVNDVFYTSDTSDALVAGSAVTPSSMSGRLVYQKITNGSTPPTPPPLPYDAEIEYLESTGTQYINTNTYITDTSNFEVGYTIAGDRGDWGWVHENKANGTWIAVDGFAYFGRWGNSSTDPTYKVNISSLLSSAENTIIYQSNSGVTVNGIFNSKTLSIGTDSIANKSLCFFAWYDFYRQGMEFSNSSKFKSFYLKNNGELVLDMIPVRVGQVGYMYDKVSGELFGNAGTGDFILGADK